MPKKKRSARKRKITFLQQAKADIAKLLKAKKELDLEVKYVKQDLNRMMGHIHHGPPFPRPRRRK